MDIELQAELSKKLFSDFYDDLKSYTSSVFQIAEESSNPFEIVFSFGTSRFIITCESNYKDKELILITSHLKRELYPNSPVKPIMKLTLRRNLAGSKWQWRSNAVSIESAGDYLIALKDVLKIDTY